MSEHMLEFTDDEFDTQVVNSEVPTMVDFWADWCAPCKMIAPAVEALAEENAGRLRVGKLNVDENPKTASRFEIRGIPTLLVFKGGEVVEQVVGVRSKKDLQKIVDQNL
ncbi:MAG: thioredoxin [Nitrospinota bacterium]|jgi:thioredoxin 1|nr:thioredoxin [Nitrospinota bacterium]MDP6619702.1 thioredoxin [Nitrospinota bacterium]MDP7385979.1 thioredoxin [Nitrospinota bacterium]HJM44030.1 thioredoxin [Nitrospinota bacterium]